MRRNEVLDEFRAADAVIEGHFLLSSGLHSPRYIQCARVMMDAGRGARLCRALKDKVKEKLARPADLIASPALGGILVGYELGRQMKVPSLFLERVDGRFVLRRGFSIPHGANCLVVEDIITTGKSAREVVEALKAQGARVIGAACLIDRSGGTARLGVRLVPLARLRVPTYSSNALPPRLARMEATQPGSRDLS